MSTLLSLLAATAAQSVVWYFVVRGVRRRAWAEGWNTGHQKAMQQYDLGHAAGFGEGIAAWARVTREFTVSKSEAKK